MLSPKYLTRSPGEFLAPESNSHGDRHAARNLDGPARRALALEVLRGNRPITQVAQEAHTSRKFVSQQRDRALQAIHREFEPTQAVPDLIGWLPVTRDWIEQVVLSAALECHGSVRGICAHIKSITGHNDAIPISEGTVCGILADAILKAIDINASHDLAAIHTGAHDEIFSQGTPVLVGVEPRSVYTYLMEPAPNRGEIAWGCALLDKAQRQGLSLQQSVADAAQGIRAGVRAAFPGIHIQGDVLHAQMQISELVSYLENRAYAKMRELQQQEQRMARAEGRSQGHRHSEALELARRTAEEAIRVYDDMAILAQWLEETLRLVGGDLADRQWAYDYVVAEISARAAAAPHRIGPVVTYLTHQRDDLLAFVGKIQEGLCQIAGRHGLPAEVVKAVYAQCGLGPEDPRYWELDHQVVQRAGPKAGPIKDEVRGLLDGIVRASSAVENVNSILRTYFFLRKTIGVEFLELLRFYLNHRRFRRSRRPERVGKSPVELLTGQTHPHWLEVLGYTRVSLAA